MSKANATEADLVAYIFNATAIPWNGVGNLYVALHTADPGEAGGQGTSEATYTGYARVGVSRDNTGWTCAGNTAVNAAQIQFGLCTAGSETLTHFSVGTASSGAGQILYSGALNSSLAVSNNVQPTFAAGGLTVSEE